MSFQPEHVQFENKANPHSGFDMVNLQELYSRKDVEVPIDTIHLVEFYILLFIQKGKGKHTIDFTTFDCQKGSLLTIRKDQIQRFHRSNSMDGIVLLFTDTFLVSYLEHLEAQKTLQLFNEQLSQPCIQLTTKQFEDLNSITEKISEEYSQINDEYSLGIIRSQLHVFLAKLFRAKANLPNSLSTKKYLSDFIQFQNLLESEKSKSTKVDYYARSMGKSTKTLNNITRHIVNLSAKDFIDDIKIKQIKRLLINTNLTVNEIAFESGFEETTNFFKYFKRLTNQT
ncbi:MAG: helix-turn-helix transcriptional regulator, partial [Bacteroidota bacterium]